MAENLMFSVLFVQANAEAEKGEYKDEKAITVALDGVMISDLKTRYY
jgi:hypothetical protein